MRGAIQAVYIAVAVGLMMPAAYAAPPLLEIPQCPQPPVLDGRLDDACWGDAARLTGLPVVGDTNAVAGHRVMVCHDAHWLYVAFDVALPADRLPPAYGWHQSELDRKIHREDHVAVSFNPRGGPSDFYQFWVNRDNVRAESRFTNHGRNWILDWDIPWRSAVRETDSGWRAELALPWSLLSAEDQSARPTMNFMVRTIVPQRDEHGVIVAEIITDASWAPLIAGFREPLRFGRIRLPDDFEVQEIFLPRVSAFMTEGYGVDAGNEYFYELAISLTNHGGLAGTVNLVVTDEPAGKSSPAVERDGASSWWRRLLGRTAGKSAGEQHTVERIVEMDAHAARSITMRVPAQKLSQRRVDLRLQSADTDAVWQNAVLRDDPRFETFYAYAGRNYYTDEPAVDIVCEVKLPAAMRTGLQVVIEDVARGVIASSAVTASPMILDVPRSVGQVDENIWRAELRDARGMVLASESMTIRQKEPNPGHEWKIDRINRVFLHNGAPFFPFGVVDSAASAFHMETIADVGFNSIIQWAGAPELESIDEYLQLARDHDLQVVFAPEQIYSRWNETTKLRDPAGLIAPAELDLLNQRIRAAGGSLLKMKGPLLGAPFRDYSLPIKEQLYLEYYKNNQAYISGAIARAMRFPNVMGYFILDEPLHETGGFAVGQALYEDINRQDGYRPIFVNYSASIPRSPDAVNWSDALGTDPYWVPGLGEGVVRNTIQFMPRVVAMTKQRADAVHSVTWTMPMLEYWSGCTKRALTGAEQKAQTYLALAHGTKGLFYFRYPFHSREMLDTMRELAGQMRVLGPICVQPDLPHQIEYSPGVLDPLQNRFTDIQARLMRNPDGGYVLLAVNSAFYPVDVTITLTGLSGVTDTVTRLFGTEKYKVTGDQFRDRFEPMDTRVYGIPSGEFVEPLALSIAMQALPDAVVKETGYSREGRVGMKNLLPNPGYEEATLRGWPDYHKKVWGDRDSLDSLIGGTDQNWGVSADRPFHGVQCLMMRTTNAAERVIAYTDLLVKNDRERTYVFSAYLRANRDDVQVVLNTGPNAIRREKQFTVNREWKRYHVPLVLPSGDFYVMMLAILRDQPGATTVWMDALQFEEGAQPTEFAP